MATISEIRNDIDTLIRDNTSGAIRPAEQRAVMIKIVDFVNQQIGGGYINGGNEIGANATIGLTDNYALSVVTNNTARMRFHANGRITYGGTTDAGWQHDFIGTARFQTKTTFTNHILLDNSTRGLIIRNREAVNLARDIIVGDNSSEYETTDGSYIIGSRSVFGSGNTWIQSGTFHNIYGNNNAIPANKTQILIFGSFNTYTDGDPTNMIFGLSNIVNYAGATTSRNLPHAIGGGNKILHQNSCAFGANQETTAAGQLIFGNYQSNIATDFNSVYFGSLRNHDVNGGYTNARAGTNVTLNGSGAGNIADTVGGWLRLASGRGTGAAIGSDIIFATPSATTAGTTLQSLTNRWWIKGDTGQLSNTASPSASAAFSVSSTTRGTLITTMTGLQAEAIASPADMLLVAISNGNGSTITSRGFWWNDAGTWTKL